MPRARHRTGFDTSQTVLRAAKSALARARACEGGTGLALNTGAAVVTSQSTLVSKASTEAGPSWRRLLELDVLPASTFVISAWPEDEPRVKELLAGLRAQAPRSVVVLDDTVATARARRQLASLGGVGIETSWGLPEGLTDARRTSMGEQVSRVHEKVRFARAHRRPFITLKAATSLDGCVGTASGHSKWITGPLARKEGHRLRAKHAAIGVGIGTVVADDPRLDVRMVRGRSPVPVVFDRTLRCVASRRTLALHRAGVVVLHGGEVSAGRLERARVLGMVPVRVRETASGLSLTDAMRKLFARGVSSLMVEGGAKLLASFVKAGLFEELWLFMAPRLLGGDGQPLLPGLGWTSVSDAPQLEVRRRRVLGDDQLWVCARGTRWKPLR